MRVGIMQPYFMPYIGYFSLIKHVDFYIVFDTVQFIRHGWIERNRILKQKDGWQYIAVSLKKHERETAIKDVKVNNNVNWKEKIKAQLTHYKKAPYYNEVIKLLEQLFAKEYDYIATLDFEALKLVCEYLSIKTPMAVFSEMDLEIDDVKSADEWALNICNKIPNANEYWNAIGGSEFFDRSKYTEAGIELKFQKVIIEAYRQKGNIFEPGLSIIDVMMFNSKDEINQMLDNFELI